MKRYAIVFPGQKPKVFIPQEESFLLESNKECNIFLEAKANDYGTHKMLVLHSTATLNLEPVNPSVVYGDYYIYYFQTVVNADRYKTFRDFMLSAYPMATEAKHYPAPGYLYNGELIQEADAKPIDNNTFQKYVLYYHRYLSAKLEIFQHQYLLARDIELMEEIQTMITTKSVLDEFPQYKSEHYYDASIDRVVNNEGAEPYGDSLTYAFLANGRSIVETKKFFNKKFGYDFHVEEEDEAQEDTDADLWSRILYDIPGLTTKWKSYYSGDKKATDFLIRVKYVMTMVDGWKKYIVDLIGDLHTTEDVEFPAVFSKAQFKQKISYYWPHHYSGWDNEITMIHKAISDTPVPHVIPLRGFWYHDNILAVENCVYDLDNQTVYEREWAFFFNRELKKWFAVLDARGTNLALTMQGIPQLKVGWMKHSLDEYKDFFSQFYNDELGMFIFLYVLAMINAGRLRKVSDFKFPFLILHGKYGSGKSSLSDMIKRVFNVWDLEKGQVKYWETTAFALLNQCSYRHGLPVFITEFKEVNETQGDSKVSSLISMYDRAVVSKGTAQQGMIYYHLDAFGILDGEELPQRSAFKSRSIIINIKSDNNALALSDYKNSMKNPILSDLFGQALWQNIFIEDFKTYRDEALEFFEKSFPKVSQRLKENFSSIYSLALLFDKELREDVKYYLGKYLMIQHEIEVDSYGVSELLDIIKKYARQMAQHDCFWYDRSNKRFCVRVDPLSSFIDRYHIKLSLWFAALKNYFPKLDYVEEDMGWVSECAIWDMWPDFPKQLLFDQHAYADYKVTVKPLAPSNDLWTS